jgi:hypothetical protein
MTVRVRIAAECVSRLAPEVRPDRPIPPPWRLLGWLRAADALCWALGLVSSVTAGLLVVAGEIGRRRAGRGPGGRRG